MLIQLFAPVANPPSDVVSAVMVHVSITKHASARFGGPSAAQGVSETMSPRDTFRTKRDTYTTW